MPSWLVRTVEIEPVPFLTVLPAGCSGVSLSLPQGGVGRGQAEVRAGPVWPPVRPFLPLPLHQHQAAAATALWSNYRAAFDNQYSVSEGKFYLHFMFLKL